MGGQIPWLRAGRRWTRGLLYVAAASIAVAGVAAIVAITRRSLGIDHLRVLGTSLGFAIFSATAAAGSSAWRDGRTAGAYFTGIATVLLSVVSLVTLEIAIWELAVDAARAFACAGLLTLAGSHASIVLRARRSDDSDSIRVLVYVSIALATLDCSAAALAISGHLRAENPRAAAQAAAVVVIAMIVTTGLQPILRAAARVGPRAPEGPLAPVAAAAGAAAPVAPAPASPPHIAQPRPLLARLTPGMACGLAVAIGLCGWFLGRISSPAERQPVPVYQPAPIPPPPAPVAYAPPPPPAQPSGSLAERSVTPGQTFLCGPMGEKRVERRRGGNGVESVELHRGPRGMCTWLAGPAVKRLRSGHALGISIVFFRADSPNRRDKAYRVIVARAPDGNGRFWVTYQPPLNVRAPGMGALPARAGRLGMSGRRLSLVVDSPLLPGWVVDPRTTWRVMVS